MEAAEQVYRQLVAQEYLNLNFSGLVQRHLSLGEVALEDVFVRLSLTRQRQYWEPERAMDGRATKKRDEHLLEREEPISLDQALSKPLLIVGEPGAGKSTLLRWLAVTFALGRQRDPDRIGPAADADHLPILIELGRLPDDYLKGESGKTPIWKTQLITQIDDQESFHGTPPALLQQALLDGRCLLLFDGLDEIANRQARVRLASSLADLPRLYPGNRVVIGSRPSGLTGGSEGVLLPTFQRCQIQRFTQKELQRFFRFWYALDRMLTPDAQQRAADALFEEVKATPGTLRLATTPLFATVLLLIWRSEGALPERRVDLYERCCQVLVEDWEQSHIVTNRGVFADLSWEQHLRLLAPIAYLIHRQEGRTSIGQEELLKLLKDRLQKEEICTNPSAAGLEAARFLETLGLRSGLLQFQGDGRYGFPHHTVQEYLTARHLAAQPDPASINLVVEHLHDAWWQEVHLLTIGRLGSGPGGAEQTSDLLRAILHRYRPPSRLLRLPRHPRWIDLGRWLPQVQLARRLAWLLRREEMLALWGAAECTSDGLMPPLQTELAARAAALTHSLLADEKRRPLLGEWLAATGRRQPRQAREAILQVLLAALQSADESVRFTAVRSLGQVGIGQPEVVQALLAALRDTSSSVSWAAAQSLGQVGDEQPEVIETLLSALHDADGFRPRGSTYMIGGSPAAAAAKSLGQVGSGQPEVIQALLAALHARDEEVQQSAAESHGQAGSGQLEVIQAFLGVTPHELNEQVHVAAAKSLGQVGSGQPEVIQALLVALHDASYKYLRWAAVQSLGQMKITDEAALWKILVSLNHLSHGPDSSVAEVALTAISRLLEGLALPGNRWKPMRSQQERTRRRRQVRLALATGMVLVALILGVTWLSSVPSLTSFFAAFGSAVALTAALVTILGMTLRDLLSHNSEKKQD